MTLTKGTIAAQIRDKIDLMHALIEAGKKDGGQYQYGEVLVLAGLPASHSYVRELSNQLIARGYRRHALKRPKPVDIPADEALPGVLDEPQPDAGDVRVKLNNAMEAVAAAASRLADLGDVLGCYYVRETFKALFPQDYIV